MENLFIPYELSLVAKEKGFNEECFYAWCKTPKHLINNEGDYYLRTNGNPFGQFFSGQNWNIEIVDNTKSKIQCSAPLYQQVIDWFREKHKLSIWCETATLKNHCSRLEGYVKNGKLVDREFEGKEYYEVLNKAIEEAFKLI